MTSSSPSNNLRWTPTASPISSPVLSPLLSKEISSFANHDQVEEESLESTFPFMSPAHHQEQKQRLDHYVDEPTAKNDMVVNSLRVLSGHQSSKKKKSEEKKSSSFVIEMEPKSKGSSVVLTWGDLCVRVPSSSGKGNDKAIIQGLNGYAQPGEVLAIMGPSGSGKSTLIIRVDKIEKKTTFSFN
ncbi:hypothetical protein MKX01_013635 [Papaver californicum]|nr:hypothetical protein MKX01_013635 [Papaver californicum]